MQEVRQRKVNEPRKSATQGDSALGILETHGWRGYPGRQGCRLSCVHLANRPCLVILDQLDMVLIAPLILSSAHPFVHDPLNSTMAKAHERALLIPELVEHIFFLREVHLAQLRLSQVS